MQSCRKLMCPRVRNTSEPHSIEIPSKEHRANRQFKFPRPVKRRYRHVGIKQKPHDDKTTSQDLAHTTIVGVISSQFSSKTKVRGTGNMTKVKVTIALVLLAGALFFSRAYYLVGFAVGYGIKDADRNQHLFLWGAIGCGLLFLTFVASLFFGTKRGR